MWMAAALVLAGVGAGAQAPAPKDAPGPGESLGPRLRVRFVETRERGQTKTATPPSTLTLHAGDKGGSLFVGTQVALRTSDKAGVIFKNAGFDARVRAEALPDGRYRLDTTLERAKLLEGEGGGATSAGANPIFQVLKGASKLVLRAGETVAFASAVDPLTGEEVRVDVALDATPVARSAAPAASLASRIRPIVVLTRRQGDKVVATRRYSVVVEVDEEKVARVFGGAMLPVEATVQGQPTVMLKDVGAGLQLVARRLNDGRYRLDLSVSDGSLAPAAGSPRVLALQAESTLSLAEGETVLIASGVDPQSGEAVEASVTLEAVR
jgi:hypothetical protein